MRAISIKQPYAWAIVHFGKDYENRTWKTKFRGPVLIHASQGWDQAGYEWILKEERHIKLHHLYLHSLPREYKFPDIPELKDFKHGGIIGAANIIDCIDNPCVGIASPWWQGPFGFKLDLQNEAEFYPLKGKLGIWETGLELKMDENSGIYRVF